MTSVSWPLRAATAAAVVLLSVSGIAALQQPPASARWTTAWSTSQQGLGTTAVTNATVRMIARVTIPGDAVRIRLDNTFGTDPLVIGKAYVGQRIQAAALAEGSNRQVFFNKSAGTTVPPGGSVTSDPVPMNVLGQQDLAVSLHITGANVRPSQHTGAQVTSYWTANGSGDATADEMAARFTGTTTSTFWLKAIDVASSVSTGSIVAFGDSITDGTCSTIDAHDRWEDVLAVRLALDAAGRGRDGAHKSVLNEGIGGNTVSRENLQPAPDSPPGIERLDRDVLSHHGVTHVILFMGTNDVRRDAPAAQVIAGMQDIIKRVKARGLKIIGVTIIPRHNRPSAENNTGWNSAKTESRNEVNQWIRAKAPFDAVIDFDKAVQDSKNANLLYAPFNCGDGIHPSPRGYYEMGKSVRLDLFK
ncbi:MAG TPA: GDSL-type esterase/lipase family protein [Terriglobia bacterium]|nr:GDSL-type esterase/lipase family protein [Terriglobia bacterium]